MGLIVLKLILAAICGGAIGFERENKNRNVGIRTYMTVCISTTIVMIIAQKCFNDTKSGDITRMAAAALQGIGFLGAGLIIQKDEKLKGITTAAILWGTAVIGLAIGYGLYFLGVVGTIFLLIIGNIMIKYKLAHEERKFIRANKAAAKSVAKAKRGASSKKK